MSHHPSSVPPGGPLHVSAERRPVVEARSQIAERDRSIRTLTIQNRLARDRLQILEGTAAAAAAEAARAITMAREETQRAQADCILAHAMSNYRGADAASFQEQLASSQAALAAAREEALAARTEAAAARAEAEAERNKALDLADELRALQENFCRVSLDLNCLEHSLQAEASDSDTSLGPGSSSPQYDNTEWPGEPPPE